MHGWLKRLIGALLFVLTSCFGFGQTFSVSMFDPPASSELVRMIGMNTAGQILGIYQGSSSAILPLLRAADGSSYTPIQVPGATETTATGINNLGQVIGYYRDPSGIHSFIRGANGILTTFDIPMHDPIALGPPIPTAINDKGDIAGTSVSIGSLKWGFLLSADRTEYATVQVPEANSTEIVSVNNSGDVSGTCQFGGSFGIKHGFVRRADGTYRVIDAPGAVQQTLITSANNLGQMIANTTILNPDGSSASLDSSLGISSIVIDDLGRVAGCATTGSTCKGFVASPASDLRPTIRPVRGVISASAFGGNETIAPGSWIEIYGSHLANTVREWRSSDFIGDMAPTSLDDVSVSINGRAAFVSYISPGQINAQVPSGLTAGIVNITVTNAGVPSGAYRATLDAAAPGILAISEDVAYTYALALFPDYRTFVLPQFQYPSIPPMPTLPSRLAKPKDTIVMFGIGFGDTSPVVSAGQIATTPTMLQGRVEILFGGVPAEIKYAGLSPGSIGLYQFNVVVPEGVENDVPIELRLNDTPVAQRKLYVATASPTP